MKFGVTEILVIGMLMLMAFAVVVVAACAILLGAAAGEGLRRMRPGPLGRPDGPQLDLPEAEYQSSENYARPRH